MSRNQAAAEIGRLTETLQDQEKKLFALAWKTLRLHGIDARPDDLEDVLSDAYLIAAGLIRRDRESITNPSGWFRSILYNTCLNEARKRGRRKRKQEQWSEGLREVHPGLSEHATDGYQDSLNRLVDTKLLMQKLDRDEASILAALLAGFTAKEIADATGSNPSAIRQRKKRLISRLRHLIEQTDADEVTQDE